jgi:hypothetical protein
MEYVDSIDDLAYITSLEQRVLELESALQDAEFILRKVGINWKEAQHMSDSAIRCAVDIRHLICKAVK